MGKIVRAGAGIFEKLEPKLEPDKNGPAPQHLPYPDLESEIFSGSKIRLHKILGVNTVPVRH
jgi:hypothetical protein